MWHDGHWIIGKYDFAAFPSGHTATAVGLATAAWLINRRWGAALTVFALAVMWSRVALGSHHFSDVVASAVLAIPLAVLSKKVLLPFLETQFVRLGSFTSSELSVSGGKKLRFRPNRRDNYFYKEIRCPRVRGSRRIFSHYFIFAICCYA